MPHFRVRQMKRWPRVASEREGLIHHVEARTQRISGRVRRSGASRSSGNGSRSSGSSLAAIQNLIQSDAPGLRKAWCRAAANVGEKVSSQPKRTAARAIV